MSRRNTSVVSLLLEALLVLLLTGCDALSIDEYDLPLPDESLDPAALRVGESLYACGRWSAGQAPDSALILVDLFFGRRGPDDPMDRPRAQSLDAVRRRGGRVLFEFAFPAARVRIAPDELPVLYAANAFNVARTVPDPRRYDWSIGVGFRRPITAQDSLDYVASGGRVIYMFHFIEAISGDLPNRSVVTG